MILVAILSLVTACAKDEVFNKGYYQCSSFVPENTPGHLKSSEFESLLSSIVSSGVPGMMLTVHDSQNSYWSGAAGIADLGSGVSLEPCNITRVGSTVKTFTAVSILLL